MDAIEAILAAFCALLLGTLAEYFIHRAMHWGIIYPEGHRRHHENNESRTFLVDVLDYGTGAAIFCWVGFVVSIPAGIGWAAGAFAYVALASYAHQLQHTRPALVFWMPRPVHGLHHAHNMTEHNFGVLVDWWDHLLGTHRSVGRLRRRSRKRRHLKDYMAIPWF